MTPDQINTTNPTQTVNDAPFAWPMPSSIHCGFGVTATWDAGIDQKGMAIAGYTVVQANAPLTGSSFGIEGGVLNFMPGADCGGMLAVVNNDSSVASASGAGIWALARGTANGANMVDGVRSSSETDSGRIRSYFLGGAGTSAQSAVVGMYIQGARDCGVQIGGPIQQLDWRPYPTPVWPILVYNNQTGTPRFSLNANGVCTSFGFQTASDARLKSDIRDVEGQAFKLVNQMRVRRYEMDGKTQIGLVAQELVEVYPNAVHMGDDEHPASIDYGKLVPLLILAIQEVAKR